MFVLVYLYNALPSKPASFFSWATVDEQSMPPPLVLDGKVRALQLENQHVQTKPPE